MTAARALLMMIVTRLGVGGAGHQRQSESRRHKRLHVRSPENASCRRVLNRKLSYAT
jgi:hypothetical protein